MLFEHSVISAYPGTAITLRPAAQSPRCLLFNSIIFASCATTTAALVLKRSRNDEVVYYVNLHDWVTRGKGERYTHTKRTEICLERVRRAVGVVVLGGWGVQYADHISGFRLRLSPDWSRLTIIDG